MKKLLNILMFSSLAILLSVGSAMAVPSTLYDILGSGWSGTEIYSDTGAEAAYLTDTDGNGDDATAFLLLEIANFDDQNTFGIYGFLTAADGTVSLGDTLEIFDGPDAPGWPATSTTLAFDISAGTVTNNSTFDVANIGTTFGFYITTPESPNGYTYYSHTSLNTLDNYDHMMIFDTSDNVVSSLAGSDIVIAVEDLYGGGDEDFTDMVIGITDVAPAPVPEPATILLLGLGLVGLAGISRKRK